MIAAALSNTGGWLCSRLTKRPCRPNAPARQLRVRPRPKYRCRPGSCHDSGVGSGSGQGRQGDRHRYDRRRRQWWRQWRRRHRAGARGLIAREAPLLRAWKPFGTLPRALPPHDHSMSPPHRAHEAATHALSTGARRPAAHLRRLLTIRHCRPRGRTSSCSGSPAARCTYTLAIRSSGGGGGELQHSAPPSVKP